MALATVQGVPQEDDRFLRARKKWKLCEEWYGSFADRFLADLRFRHGDAENGNQWDEGTRRARGLERKPCLTLNMVQVHNRMITNQARRNRIGMNVAALGAGASQKASLMFRQLLERIEHHSSAQDVYALARGFQVDGGVGYFRIETRWAKGDGFEQEIYLAPVDDPMRVWLDPDAKLPHGGDANFGFEWDLVHKDLLRSRYRKLKGDFGGSSAGFGDGVSYTRPDYVRVCEFIERNVSDVELISFLDPSTGERKSIRGSLLPPEVRREVKAQRTTRVREVEDYTVQSTVYVGDQQVEHTKWPGSYVPIVRVEGEKTVLDGQLDYRGHTRAMLDAQRMYNYNASAQVEFVALQGKTPWVGAAESIEPYEAFWKSANTTNHSYLPYKHTAEDGTVIPPPTRAQPPVASQAFEAGMTTAIQQMQLVSGQHDNQLGIQGNERTGAAINARQGQSDLATSHFDDNFESAVLWAGQQIIELIPLVYDTKRLVMIQAPEGDQVELQIDPSAQQAYEERLASDGSVAARVLNPKVGRYEVRSRPGPDMGTKREQTAKSIEMLLTQNPAFASVVGDLLLECLDFDKADEAAQRLRRMVPKQALGEGPSAAEQQMQQQIDSLKAALAKSLEAQGKAVLKAAGREEARDIDAYKAVTDRIAVFVDALAGGAPGSAEGLDATMSEAKEVEPLGALVRANADELEDSTQVPDGVAPQPPHPDARQAPDGQWYLGDPARPGKFLRLDPRGA